VGIATPIRFNGRVSRPRNPSVREDGASDPAPGAAPPIERVARRLYRHQLLDAGECRDLLAKCDRLTWREASVTPDSRKSSVVRSIRFADNITFGDLPAGELEQAGLQPYLDRLEQLARRVDRTKLRMGFTRLQSGQLIRYPLGGYYAWHRDAAVTRFRKVSALLYLSDAESHGVAGGETLFAPQRFRKHWRPISIAPTCGAAMVFDSRLHHRALPTLAGAKYVLLMMFV
jgi:hypothetical protein